MEYTARSDSASTARPERALLDAFDFLVRLYVSMAGTPATRALIRALRDEGRNLADPAPEHHLLLARRLERQLAFGDLPSAISE